MDHCFLRFPGGKAKAATFSYDDGLHHDIRLSETLCRYGLKGTFNINSDFLATEPGGWCLTREEVLEHIVKAGHEVAVHGHQHLAPGLHRPIQAIQDVLNCRLALENLCGTIIRGMAYPNSGILNMQNGATYDSIRNYLTDLGIVYARSLGGDNNRFRLPEDWLNWVPTCHHDNPNTMNWIREFVDMKVDPAYVADRFPRLLYIWGHSYEFHNKNNWDHLEAICQAVSGRDDIWYATNMEIYEYVQAYQSLVFSANGNLVYNPSLMTIWIIARDRILSIAPGETLAIV